MSFNRSFGANSTGFGNPSISNANNDIEVQQPPEDSISCLRFSPTANFLAASSWDGEVRVYEVNQTGQTQGKAMTKLEQPVLCCAWSPDGSSIFAAGCSRQAKMWTLQNNQTQVVAQHEAPIRHMAWVEQHKLLVTGSWDKTLKYWDLRQQQPALNVPLQERCYALDVKQQMLVVGTAEKALQVYNLNQPQQPYKTHPSLLQHQTRSISCFPSQTGFLVGSIGGRVSVQHVEEKDVKDNFTFKCHRDGNDVFAINAIDFHPVQHTFLTAGSDGSFHYWDKDSKQRVKSFPRSSESISDAVFNQDGQYMAYAVSYDWSKGHAAYTPGQSKNHILIHKVLEAEVKKKEKAPVRR